MDDSDGSQTAADAFAALANPLRVGIVRALGETAADDPQEVTFLPFDHPERGLSYTALRDRVPVDDNGQFNYHLDKVVGSYLEKHDDQYRLTWLGILAYRFLVVGRFSAAPVTRQFDLDEPCHRCGEGVTARYTEDQLLYVDCTGCGLRTMMIHVPQHGIANASREALLSAGATRYLTHIESLTAGHCPWCSGRVAASIHRSTDPRRGQPVVTYLCRACGGVYFPSVGGTLLSHPAVVAFCHERGVDLSRYPWTIPFAFDPDRATVTSTDPFRVVVDVQYEGDCCLVTVDRDRSVRSVTVDEQ
jgi:DNA-directed RNA polymerase subunit RPC12/RpoP